MASSQQPCQVLICGAGIAGIAAAYQLAVVQRVQGVVLVDARPPLSLTSDKSSEAYRNWWPGPDDAQVAFMNRSLDWLERLALASGNRFHLNRRGYLYLTADLARIPQMEEAAAATSALGAGPLRRHTATRGAPAYQPLAPEGFAGQPDGADLITDRALLRQHFPYLAPTAVAALHVRRAGWLSAQQLGAFLLEEARAAGVSLLPARLSAVERSAGRVSAVWLDESRHLPVQALVNAAGPFLPAINRMLGLRLPVTSQAHYKLAFKDALGAVPRQAPLLVWSDPQRLPWSAEERAELLSDPATAFLTGPLPPGAHTRPEGSSNSRILLMLWDYHPHRPIAAFADATEQETEPDPPWPLPLDPLFPDVVLRGLLAMLPGLQPYLAAAPRPALDGGYYTHTPENRPLIGPLEIPGAFICGAFSGYGIMAALAAGELLAAHLLHLPLPSYAPAFAPNRYADPVYRRRLAGWGETGQL